MSSSRQRILNQVRQNRPPEVALPHGNPGWTEYDDPLEQFLAIVQTVGGMPHVVATRQEGAEYLAGLEAFAPGTQGVSLVPGIGDSTFALDTLATPHELSGLDWAILPGEFAVAENGAIWVTDRAIRHRAVYFLCEHLVLVVPRGAIVHNMPQAYERLAELGRESPPPFGTFISGPSKTADIEQSLVIGAQGPRSLRVLLLDENAP